MSDDANHGGAAGPVEETLPEELELDLERSGDWRGKSPSFGGGSTPRAQTLDLKSDAYTKETFRHIQTAAMSAISEMPAAVADVRPGGGGAGRLGASRAGDTGHAQRSAEFELPDPGSDRPAQSPPSGAESGATTAPFRSESGATTSPRRLHPGTGSTPTLASSRSDSGADTTPTSRAQQATEPQVIQARASGSRLAASAGRPAAPAPPYQLARRKVLRRRALIGLIMALFAAAIAYIVVAGPEALLSQLPGH